MPIMELVDVVPLVHRKRVLNHLYFQLLAFEFPAVQPFESSLLLFPAKKLEGRRFLV
jgi:hypothetical protein